MFVFFMISLNFSSVKCSILILITRKKNHGNKIPADGARCVCLVLKEVKNIIHKHF